MAIDSAPPVVRDPAHMLDRTLAQWGGCGDIWVFGYASLIWRPEFDSVEQRPAIAYGWHRAMQMRSRINRGTPERPGLVFALVQGGSCRGMAYRVAQADVPARLERLWAREMATGTYDPKWLNCRTTQGGIKALAFTLSRQSPNHTGPLPDEQLVDIFRTAQGRFGTTLAYLVDTARSLRDCGIRDRDVERLVALARQHALTA